MEDSVASILKFYKVMFVHLAVLLGRYPKQEYVKLHVPLTSNWYRINTVVQKIKFCKMGVVKQIVILNTIIIVLFVNVIEIFFIKECFNGC